MPNLGNLYFVLEILLAELSLLFFYPKKKHFWIHYPVSFVLVCAIALLIPNITSLAINQFYSFSRFLLLFLMTIPAMFLCFKTPLINLISACGAGYAVQHIGHKVTVLMLKTELFSSISDFMVKMHLAELIAMPIIFVLVALSFGLIAKKNQYYKNKDAIFIVPPLVTLFVCLVLNRVASVEGADSYSISLSCYSITCCLLCLFLQYYVHDRVMLRKEKNAIALLYQRDKELYEMKKKDIELLNVKYHDMKKRLSQIESLTPEEVSSIKKIVKVYATHYKTGCEVLDTILTDKTSKLTDSGVEITFMGDASSLNGINVGDCYSLFENVVDNAVEAVAKFDDPNKKTIGIQIAKKGNLTVVNCYNYFQGTLKMNDGLPETTKKEEEGFHGYGMKSIKLIAEKYHGGINITAEDNVFDLSIYLINQ